MRILLALSTDGAAFDLNSLQVVRELLRGDDPLGIYAAPALSSDIGPFDIQRWPYAPGFFVPVLATGWLEGVLGIDFKSLIRFPGIFADAAIAWLVFAELRRGATERLALAGCAFVALGPSFIAISGHHGQIDSVAVLPALIGLVLWRREIANRAVVCGLLIGLGAAIKTPAGLLVLALLPTAMSRREALSALAAAAAVPAVLLLPFVLAEPRATIEAIAGYAGLPGVGGMSLLLQPDLGRFWLSGDSVEPSALVDAAQGLNALLVVVALGALTWALIRRRTDAAIAACALALAFWAVGVNFSLTQVVVGLSVLLVAGYVREAAAVQAVLLAPTLMIYLASEVDGWSSALVYAVFVPCMAILTIGSAIGAMRLLVRPPARASS